MIAEEGPLDVIESVRADTVVIFNDTGFFFFPVKTRGESLHRWKSYV